MINKLKYQGPFITVIFAMICIQFDLFAVSLALNSIGETWNLTHQSVQWVISVYLIGVGLAMFPAGIASDQYGHKKLLLMGAIGFAFATLGCGLAQEFQTLLFARAIQGISAGIMVPTGIAYITKYYTNFRLKIAIVVSIGYIAMVLGPSVGAYLVKLYSWRAVFWGCLPVILISILIGWISPKPNSELQKTNTGNLKLSLKLTLCLGVSIIPMFLSIPVGLKCILSILIVSSVLVHIYMKSKADVQYQSLIATFKNIPLKFYEMLFLGIISNTLLLTLIFSFPFILQNFYGWSVVRTGYAFFGIASLIAIASLLMGKISNAYEKKVFIIAITVIIISYLILLVSNVYSNVIFLITYHTLGFFLGATNSLVIITIQSVIPKSIVGLGSGLSKTLITVIGALGIVFSSHYIDSQSLNVKQIAGLHSYLFYLCILALLGGIILKYALYLRGKYIRISTGQ